MLKSVAGLLAIAIAIDLAAAAQTTKKPAQEMLGKQVHIVQPGCPGEGGCDFKIWTTKKAAKLWAKPDEKSAVVVELAKGTRVKGIAAQTVITHLPLCTFIVEDEGDRVDCLLNPDCQPTKFHPGDTFFILMYDGEGFVSIQRGDVEFQISERGEYVKSPDGNEKYVVNNYKCQGELKSKTWVQVKLPNGTTGWSGRDNFNGTSQYD